jgi:hypothetical protein
MYGLNHAYLGIMYTPQLILDSSHQTFDLLGRLPEDSDLMRMKASDSFDVAISLFCKLEGKVMAC